MSETTRSMIGPYESRPVACHPYDPRAAIVAQKVAECIAPHLPKLRVEHIGSTAVPNAAGKGIVDCMIAVPDGQMDAVKPVLESLGFQHQPGPNPFPEDRPMRVGSMVHDGDLFLLHVHLIPAQSSEVEDMRFFRSCLRSDPELLKAYVACKREIISNGITDPSSYTDEKSKFIKDMCG
jgi:GrpB-like predicted nucleotidyltransferase (UPF0157 family)